MADSQIPSADECLKATIENHDFVDGGGDVLLPEELSILVTMTMAAESIHLVTHQRKLELYQTLNELKYDDSILFKSGCKTKRKHEG